MTTLDELAKRIVAALMLELESREIPSEIELEDGTVIPFAPIQLSHTEQTKVLWEAIVIGMVSAYMLETDPNLHRWRTR